LYGHTPFLAEEGGRQQTKMNIVVSYALSFDAAFLTLRRITRRPSHFPTSHWSARDVKISYDASSKRKTKDFARSATESKISPRSHVATKIMLAVLSIPTTPKILRVISGSKIFHGTVSTT
jgi:hypothetical protein